MDPHSPLRTVRRRAIVLGAAAAGIVCSALLFPEARADLDDLRKSGLSREPGAVYLEDVLDKPIDLKVVKPAPIYYQLDGRRRLGTLVADQTVRLVAISDKAYRVRGRAEHGNVSGWVGHAFLEEPSETFRGDMKKLHERQLLVEQLVAAGEVALGMTEREVVASLGEPDAQSSRLDADSHTSTLSYITYDRVPQTVTRRDVYGRLFNTTVFVKVETGRMSVNFTDGVVTSIERDEAVIPKGGVKIVPAPLVFR